MSTKNTDFTTCPISDSTIIIGGIRVQMEKKSLGKESINKCIECNELIIIEPFQCIMCNDIMCTRCFYFNEICSKCISLITSNDICKRCNINEAIVNQACDTCRVFQVVSCKKCLKQYKNGLVECFKCYEQFCPKCVLRRPFTVHDFRTCVSCGLEMCKYCITTIRDPDGEIRWICPSRHVSTCSCYKRVYLVPSRKCRYPDCKLYCCEMGYFDKNMWMCHNHIGKCAYCKQRYAKSKDDKLLGFKYNPPKSACKKCFKNAMLLFWVNKHQRNRLPKDILTKIIKFLI